MLSIQPVWPDCGVGGGRWVGRVLDAYFYVHVLHTWICEDLLVIAGGLWWFVH